MDGFKVCKLCQTEMPIEQFSKKKGNLQPNCKKCSNERARDYRQKYVLKNDTRGFSVKWQLTEKKCPACKLIKKRHEFAICKHNQDGCSSYCRECASEWQKFKRGKRNRWKIAGYVAKHRGLSFTLTEQEYNDLIAPDACHYCDEALPKTGGLDRIDNARGYEPGNVVPCCLPCNRIRGDNFTHEEMMELAPSIREIRSRRRTVA